MDSVSIGFRPFVIMLVFNWVLTPVLNAQEDRRTFFEKRIRPVLVEFCIDCHGEDDPSGKLRLDSRAGWSRGGERGPAIVPRDPNASLLFQAINHSSKELKMPPPDTGESLTAAQIEDVKRWIQDGAFDPRDGQAIRKIDVQAKNHWAFQPLPDSFPDFGNQNPIDFFVERNLAKAKLEPLPAANPDTLVRRATFDLIGLPPTEHHYSIGRKNYDQLIDELINSPQYGERWARHWLDVARYSDAKDGVLMYGDARIRPFAYTYRDYVIRAFNDDLPFDQFIRHQLAADRMDLPNDSPYLAALGFLTLGRMFDRNRHDVIDDQIDVTTRGFLGLTASCARCHDHKFDPIPTSDYYSLYGIFASILEPLQRPRIGAVSEKGQAFESEIKDLLERIRSLAKSHYERELETARNRTSDYLVHVATTEPDYAETAIFFKSLIPGQLRPQIIHRWRKLIAKRAQPNDPLFGPWHDLIQRYERYLVQNNKQFRLDEFLNTDENRIDALAEQWTLSNVDPDLVHRLIKDNPLTPDSIARSYGNAIDSFRLKQGQLVNQVNAIESQLRALESYHFNLSDIVAGGNGFGTGTKGHGIHPATGASTDGNAGFIDIPKPDQLIPVKGNPFIDGVFVPKSGTAFISTSGIKLHDLPASSGKTWDFFKFDLSSGSSESKIGKIDYSVSPNWVMAMHANKGLTFDLKEFRKAIPHDKSQFRAILGNSGAKGQSQIDFFVYVDGKQIEAIKDFKAQSEGRQIVVELNANNRFLTLIALEGKQGISHDQVILGNPAIYFHRNPVSEEKKNKIEKLIAQKEALETTIREIKSKENQSPIHQLLFSRNGPIWFPAEEVEFYLSRQPRDQFRGLLNQIDTIAVRHRSAADRAMVVRDRNQLVDPVIFQRGDPAQRGTPVTRRTLSIIDERQTSFTNGSGRLELANSIASTQNPLTARVWMNRVWMHHFGEPLVENPSDFGLQTKPPVQQELLDFLARTFIKSGWKTKPIHKLIIASQAYRRTSIIPPDKTFQEQLRRDPDNRYLWRGHRRRLDLEQMRDAILAVSGNLDNQMFGRPSLITDANNHRRTIYAFVERQNLPDIIQSFDAANADTSTAKRPNTIVPQQALFAMNSRFVLEQAKVLAKSVGDKPNETAKVESLFQRLFHRSPTKAETDFVMPVLEKNGLDTVAHVLLMSNEFMFID